MRYLAPRVSDTPRPDRCRAHTHLHAHTLLYTPGLWRWMEFATLQWAFDAKTMEEAAHIWHTVCASVFLRAANNMGSTLPGPSAPGLVGGLWVIVSRGRPKMMLKCHEAQKDGRGFPTDTPFSYRVAPSQKHTGVERQVNITYIKSPYTEPNLSCAWMLVWPLTLQRRSSGKTKSSFVTHVHVSFSSS